MNYLPSHEFQLQGFLYSILLGFILSTAYDILKIVFFLITLKRNKLTNIRDVIFSVVSLFATFIYLLVMCEGQVLFYALFGELTGFSLHSLIVRRYIFNPVFEKLPKHGLKSDIKYKIKQKMK